ncbi:hypothetical protein C8R44DRAFT_800113 [Mycena epipterygia]|nr:hypothetical protein C8R44DRAFT_800113 [Mycena epipterygia]
MLVNCVCSACRRKNGPAGYSVSNSTQQAHEKIEAQQQLQKNYSDGEDAPPHRREQQETTASSQPQSIPHFDGVIMLPRLQT